jgi:hypothetical protein
MPSPYRRERGIRQEYDECRARYGWQDGVTFDGLTSDRTYYFFARVKASSGEHTAGAASSSLAVTTRLPAVAFGDPADTGNCGYAVDMDFEANGASDNVGYDLRITLPRSVTRLVWQEGESAPVTHTFDLDSLVDIGDANTYSFMAALNEAMGGDTDNPFLPPFSQMADETQTFSLADSQGSGTYTVTMLPCSMMGESSGTVIPYDSVTEWFEASEPLTMNFTKVVYAMITDVLSGDEATPTTGTDGYYDVELLYDDGTRENVKAEPSALGAWDLTADPSGGTLFKLYTWDENESGVITAFHRETLTTASSDRAVSAAELTLGDDHYNKNTYTVTAEDDTRAYVDGRSIFFVVFNDGAASGYEAEVVTGGFPALGLNEDNTLVAVKTGTGSLRSVNVGLITTTGNYRVSMPELTFGTPADTGTYGYEVDLAFAASDVGDSVGYDLWITPPAGITELVWQEAGSGAVTLPFDEDTRADGSADAYSFTKALYIAAETDADDAASPPLMSMTDTTYTFSLTDAQADGTYTVRIKSVAGTGELDGTSIPSIR